jgi:hypothetical protein
VVSVRDLLRGRGGRGCLRGLWNELGCGLIGGFREGFGECFCDVGLAGPPEDLVVAQVAVVRDNLHVAFGGLDEVDQVAVVIGQTHLRGPPYTPPCGGVRAHKSAENPGFCGASGWRDGRRKSWKFWPQGFDFCCGARTNVVVCGVYGSGAGWGGSGVRTGGVRRHTGVYRAGSPWHGCDGSALVRLCHLSTGELHRCAVRWGLGVWSVGIASLNPRLLTGIALRCGDARGSCM